ncbi:MAG: tryptophan synthase subunit beta, partial [Eggerthella lenta]
MYMGAEDMKRQRLNVIRMEMLGAKVVPALSGQRTLKEAVDEALAAWIANPDTFYVLGSAVGPHPYPTMVRHFQAVIGCEAREQMLAECG